MIDVGRPLTTNLAVEDVVAEQTDLRDGKPRDRRGPRLQRRRFSRSRHPSQVVARGQAGRSNKP